MSTEWANFKILENLMVAKSLTEPLGIQATQYNTILSL